MKKILLSLVVLVGLIHGKSLTYKRMDNALAKIKKVYHIKPTDKICSSDRYCTIYFKDNSLIIFKHMIVDITQGNKKSKEFFKITSGVLMSLTNSKKKVAEQTVKNIIKSPDGQYNLANVIQVDKKSYSSLNIQFTKTGY